MKKFFGLLFVAIAMIACSSDDDSNDSISGQVEGTWKLTAMNAESAFDFNGDGIESINIIEETDCYRNEILQFNADGTGMATSNSYADIELEFVFGSTDEYDYVIECISETEITEITYGQNGDQITLMMDGMSVTGTISNNTFTYVVPSGFFVDVEDPESGTMTVVEDITFVYTKQ